MLPLIVRVKTKFAPIYVGDVAKAIVKALEINNSESKIYELEARKLFHSKNLMEILLTEIKKKKIFNFYSFGCCKVSILFFTNDAKSLINT